MSDEIRQIAENTVGNLLVKKYINLLPKKVTRKRLFLTYRRGCINCPIGINIMGNVSKRKKIAAFLKLPSRTLFTRHSFRRSSATHLANSGGDFC